MSKNPFLNALAAILYIIVVASIVYYGPRLAGPVDDSIIAPVAFLSLFVLSAAVMGYIFFYQPLQLYLDGDKKASVGLFLKTLAVFGAITFSILLILFLSNFLI